LKILRASRKNILQLRKKRKEKVTKRNLRKYYYVDESIK
jgi:hypothetical protein